MPYTVIPHMKKVNTFPLPFELFFVSCSDKAIIRYIPATINLLEKTGLAGWYFFIATDGTVSESFGFLTVFGRFRTVFYYRKFPITSAHSTPTFLDNIFSSAIEPLRMYQSKYNHLFPILSGLPFCSYSRYDDNLI